MISRNNILAIAKAISVLMLLFASAWLARNYAQSERFGDEAGNMAAGHLITKGLAPYKDMQLNHQPLVYIFSAFVDSVTRPSNLFIFIQRQREALFVYAAVWNILYFVIFGPVTLLFSALFELTKYENSGYKLMGETLAVYPLVFMFGILVKNIFVKARTKKFELVLFSISSFVAIFSLAPLWPTIFALNALLFLRLKNNLKHITLLLFPQTILAFLLFLFIPFDAYMKETITYNFRYLIPVLDRVNTWQGYMKIVFLPFTSVFSLTQNKSQAVFIGIILYGILTYHFFKKKKTTIWIIMLCVITLSNTRVASLDRNFHAIPWLGVYFFIPLYLVIKTHHLRTHRLLFYSSLFLLSLIPIAYIRFAVLLFRPHNRLTEHHNNYVQSQRYGGAIKAVKDGDDRLISLPYDPLVYYVADVSLATRVLEYYSWVYTVPEHLYELKDTFTHNPPEFVVDAGLDDDHPVDRFVLSHLEKNYINALHQNTPSYLYILKKKIPEIKKNQWENFNNLLFTLPK